jgi:hypothetical protein
LNVPALLPSPCQRPKLQPITSSFRQVKLEVLSLNLPKLVPFSTQGDPKIPGQPPIDLLKLQAEVVAFAQLSSLSPGVAELQQQCLLLQLPVRYSDNPATSFDGKT